MTKIQYSKKLQLPFLDFTLVEGVAVCPCSGKLLRDCDGDEAEILDAVEANNKEVCLQSALWCHYYFLFSKILYMANTSGLCCCDYHPRVS